MNNPRSTSSTGSSSTSSSSSSSSSAPRYGFIRNTNTWGVNSIPWDQMKSAGLTPTLAANDPNFDQAMAAAQKKGINPAIWIAPEWYGDSPEAFAQRISALYKQYGSAIVPNIEYTGKGGQGTQGWDWNQRFMDSLTKAGVPPQMAVAMLPGYGDMSDFNYKAYTDRGVHIMPEAYGATYDEQYDPELLRQKIIAQGVPPELADSLLAPNELGGRTGGSVYTIDDLTPDQLKTLADAGINPQAAVAAANAAAGQGGASDGYSQVSSGGSSDGYTQVPSHGSGYSQVTDKNNPAAVQYARTRLHALRAQGITPEQYGLSGLDPTAQWRALSTIVGARQAISSGHAGDYHIGADTPPQIAAYVQHLIGAAQTPNEPGSDVAQRPGQSAGPAGESAPPVSNAQALQNMAIAARTFAPTRSVPGRLAAATQRIGPMQQAIHAAAAVKFLRSTARTPGVARA